MKFRPRFSVRTLAIVVTLVCAYFAAWEATKEYGIGLPTPWDYSSHSPIPLLIVEDDASDMSYAVSANNTLRTSGPRRYYIWLFGPRIKLPFESTWVESVALPIKRIRFGQTFFRIPEHSVRCGLVATAWFSRESAEICADQRYEHGQHADSDSRTETAIKAHPARIQTAV
jgi:hypothetical protein